VRHLRKLPREIQLVEENLRPIMQLQTHPIAHDKLVQGLWLEYDLKRKISRLKAYRANGITSFRGESK